MRINHHLKSEKGQSVILIAMMMLSFLMFFGFVINTGLLIAAKISLQTAADTAAYAGAATQARQLNAISYLNYDMRRQFKKFLYRYSFVGSIGNPGFPQVPPPGVLPMSDAVDPKAGYYSFWKRDHRETSTPDLNYRANNMNVPVVCIPLTTKSPTSGVGQSNDNCLQISLPNNAKKLTDIYPSGGLTAITQQLFSNITQIQAVQSSLCTGQGKMNIFVLLNWLFRGNSGTSGNTNTDPDLVPFLAAVVDSGNTMTQADRDAATATIKGLVKGLGLLPRNLITSMRIDTLAQFLNIPPQTEVNKDWVAAKEGSQQAESYERTILAFKSALSNLNTDVMAHQDVTMTELQARDQINLAPVTTAFNTYVQIMLSDQADKPTICNSAVLPFPISGVPVGTRKIGTSFVHYAVKLTAKAKLLFLPIKDGIELEAVAGAKPFGSRIGPPDLKGSDFVETMPNVGKIGGIAINDCQGEAGCDIPNLAVKGSDTFYKQDFLNELSMVASDNHPGSINLNGMLKAQDRAMAPYAHDVGTYNILPPSKQDKDLQYEFVMYTSRSNPKDKTAATDAPTVYRFYAPLYASGSGDSKSKIDAFIEKVFPTTVGGANASPFGIDNNEIKRRLKSDIGGYFASMANAPEVAENQESLTFAAVELPIQKGVLPSTNRSWLTEANEVLTSWGPDSGRLDGGQYGMKPRFGYSVKFVTMQNLLRAGMPATDDDLTKVSH